jgi:hypothetical protein
VAPRTNPIRNASPPAALHRCGRYSAETWRAEDQSIEPEGPEIPNNAGLPDCRLTKLTHDVTMIFNDEWKVVNDPGKANAWQ